jgi:Ca-activated chloride channel family protein
MAEGETPLLRGPSPSDEVLLIDPLSPGVGAPGGDAEAAPAPAYEDIAPEGGGEEGAPEGDRDITEPVKDLPRMPATLVREEIERDLRTERPYESMDALVDFELTTYRDPQGEAFFRLRIYPKQGEDIEVLPKDVTLVIDASRSIMQRKLELTAQGAERILASLRPEDRFNVLLFRDAPQPFRPEPVRATPDNLAQARRFLEGLKSRGETDVYQAMQPVIDTPPREGYPGIVLVVTDGRPTTGVRDGRTIINGLSQRNQLGQTIFTYGGGNTVNRTLLDLLAYRNRGASYFSPDLGDIDNDLPSFFGTLSDPILVDCQADFGRVPEQETFPSDLPDFYRDRVVTLYGRYDPAQHQEFVMRLTGQAGVEDKEIIFRADLEQAQTGDPDIARMWAFRKIYHLIGEIVRAGEQPELIEELRRLSREYRIATSYDEAL